MRTLLSIVLCLAFCGLIGALEEFEAGEDVGLNIHHNEVGNLLLTDADVGANEDVESVRKSRQFGFFPQPFYGGYRPFYGGYRPYYGGYRPFYGGFGGRRFVRRRHYGFFG